MPDDVSPCFTVFVEFHLPEMTRHRALNLKADANIAKRGAHITAIMIRRAPFASERMIRASAKPVRLAPQEQATTAAFGSFDDPAHIQLQVTAGILPAVMAPL